MRGSSKYRIRENDIESVEVCAYVRVLSKPDDIAAATALCNSERLVRQLLPVLLPDVTARQKIIGGAEPRDVDSLVQADRRVDIRAANEDVLR